MEQVLYLSSILELSGGELIQSLFLRLKQVSVSEYVQLGPEISLQEVEHSNPHLSLTCTLVLLLSSFNLSLRFNKLVSPIFLIQNQGLNNELFYLKSQNNFYKQLFDFLIHS